MSDVDLAIWSQSYGLTDEADSNGDGESNGTDFLDWQMQRRIASVADFNQDLFVDELDLDIWNQTFGDYPRGDANGDLANNGSDYLIWQRENGFRARIPQVFSHVVAVPEPVGAAMLLLFAFGYLPASHRLRNCQ